ncbi:MazG-like family protein [Halobacillus salinus]|uniref:MazG-like family protein n=1 Tax=Halobacillus salinus TaxID=192814 RepID=UPI0009A5D6CD|nr:MazG-like family protein [Halobacillus salinus]
MHKSLRNSLQIHEAVMEDIKKERFRQDDKWGVQRHSYPFWLTILTEEVGEVAQAMQQGSAAYKETDADDLYTELIHVSAVAAAIAEQVQEEREVNRQ